MTATGLLQTARDLVRSSQFAARVRHLLSQHHVPGVAIAIIEGGEMASKGFGHASLEPLVPFEADTLMDIASASKSITAAAIALLVDDDEKCPEVQWDSIVSQLLPGDFIMPEDSHTERHRGRHLGS